MVSGRDMDVWETMEILLEAVESVLLLIEARRSSPSSFSSCKQKAISEVSKCCWEIMHSANELGVISLYFGGVTNLNTCGSFDRQRPFCGAQLAEPAPE